MRVRLDLPEVTVVEKESRLLPRWEPEARERVAQALVAQGRHGPAEAKIFFRPNRKGGGCSSFPSTRRKYRGRRFGSDGQWQETKFERDRLRGFRN